MSTYYGRQVTGIHQTGDRAGRLKYEEIDGVAGIKDGDRTVIGSPHPDFTYGINSNMEVQKL